MGNFGEPRGLIQAGSKRDPPRQTGIESANQAVLIVRILLFTIKHGCFGMHKVLLLGGDRSFNKSSDLLA